jgi:hypothetical protein
MSFYLLNPAKPSSFEANGENPPPRGLLKRKVCWSVLKVSALSALPSQITLLSSLDTFLQDVPF